MTKPPLERIEAVMDELWKRADIYDRPVEVRGHTLGTWANDLFIALEELNSSAASLGPDAPSLGGPLPGRGGATTSGGNA